MIQKLGTFLLGILICFLAMYFVNTRKIDSVIKDLKLENDSLHRANLVLDSLENKYIQELNNSTYEILKLETEDNALESKVHYMNKEIIIIKNKYEKEDKLNGETVHVIQLFPKNPAKAEFHTITLYISKAGLELKKAVMKSKDGTSMTYSLSRFDANPTIDDSKFVFSKAKYPGYPVIKD